MTATLHRRPLTDLILSSLRSHFATSNIPIGDAELPAGGGWPSAGVNVAGSKFTPYLVLTTLTSSARSTASIADPQGDWRLPYLYQAFGTRRDQCEWMADEARDVLAALTNTSVNLGTRSYQIQQVWSDSIGGVNRVPEVNPPFYGEQDGFTVWLTPQ